MTRALVALLVTLAPTALMARSNAGTAFFRALERSRPEGAVKATVPSDLSLGASGTDRSLAGDVPTAVRELVDALGGRYRGATLERVNCDRLHSALDAAAQTWKASRPALAGWVAALPARHCRAVPLTEPAIWVAQVIEADGPHALVLVRLPAADRIGAIYHF